MAFDYQDQHNLRLADRISPVKEAFSKVTDLIKFMEIRIRGHLYSHTTDWKSSAGSDLIRSIM